MNKKIIMPLAVVITALVFTISSAFDGGGKDKKPKKDFLTTYYYIGDDSEAQQKTDTLYVKNPGTLPNCPDQGAIVCKIVTATDEGANPDFSERNPVDDPDEFESLVKKPASP